jgi:hypothetical protein
MMRQENKSMSEQTLTPEERKELKQQLEHALAQPEGTLQRSLGEMLIKLNPPID